MGIFFELLAILCLCACQAKIHTIKHRMQPRIVGGSRAVLTQFPYVVTLKIFAGHSGKKVKCSGTIVTENWVLTAAHCYRHINFKNDGTRILAATTDINKTGAPTQERWSKEIYVHDKEELDRKFFAMDMALIEINKPFEFNLYVQPITLAKSPFPSWRFVDCLSIGYGRIDDAGEIKNTALHYLPSICGDYQFCNDILPNLAAWPEFLCLKTNENGSSTCTGDSGGPLVCDGVLAGVLSGKARVEDGTSNGQCSGTSAVSVYMFVGFFEDWLREYIPELPEFESIL